MKRFIAISFVSTLIVALGAWSSAEAAATIDVRPGNDHNYVNPKSNGVIPVALMGAEDFEVNSVAINGLALSAEGAETSAKPQGPGNLIDLNDDGYLDILLHFRVQETGIKAGDTELCLAGSSFQACDAITTIPENPGNKGNPNN